MGKDQDLLEACRTGNEAAIDKLLSGRLNAKVKGSRATGGGALSSLSKGILSLKSANVNCVDNSGDTPLHLAALNGHKVIVEKLLDCDASPTILDSQDCSPLHLAAWSGHTDICQQLLLCPDGQALTNLQTKDGNTALHFSAQHGHDNSLSLLLQNKADPTIRNLDDFSPLDLAAQYDRLDIVKQLVTSHPELVAQRSGQTTPLHLASRNGHRSVVQYLLDSGFPIDAKTDKGTALHEAANFCKLDVIRLLLERGIDITLKSQTGCTVEDILRSIPSKAAEDALQILKTHIYHQRTPDSDGEKGIVPDKETELPKPDLPQSTPPPPTRAQPPNLPPPATRASYLHKSLPPNAENNIAPPPIPPRQSVRIQDRSDSFSESGLAPLKVPSEKDPPSDEDKTKLSKSPRDISPSTRSPSELPKKPPRKKPLSFRKPDQGPPLAADSSVNGGVSTSVQAVSGGSNYVNLDPGTEKALIDAKISSESEADSKAANPTSADTTSVAATSNVPTSVIPQAGNNSSEKQGETVQKESLQGDNPVETPPVSDEITAPEQKVCDQGVLKDETSTKPPTSLDIGQSVEGPKPSPRSPSHHHQPPTPDCPPPSPSTALQNIQRKIQPMEHRRSRDMETITDSSLSGPDDASPPTETSSTSSATAVDDLTHDSQKALLTPVSEEVGMVHQPRTSQKMKPKPLPRKSSLSSETKDLYTTQSSPAPGADSRQMSSSSTDKTSLEGYEGGKPANHGRVLKKQDQIEAEENSGLRVNSNVAGVKSASSVYPSTGQEDRSSFVEVMGETVQMRRSVSAGNEPIDWEGHVFAGLLRGSVIGPARDVVHQLSANNVSASSLRKKRKSTLSTFAPVMEEDKDIDPEKVLSEIENIGVGNESSAKKSDQDNVFDDDSEEWEQIRATFETFGVSLSRESVFVREHEANFAKFLSAGKQGVNKIQSVGEWLSDIGLPQYENTLVANGFDDTDFLGGSILEDQDLLAIGVDNAAHRQMILESASKLAKLQPIDPSNPPSAVAEWLGSLRLDYYFDTFMSHNYNSMDRVIQLWELELVTVLDMTSIGHRKRILASLGERRPDTSNSPARTRLPSLERASEPRSLFDHVDLYRDYTGVKSRVSDTGSDSDAGQGSLLDFENSDQGSPAKGRSIRDSSIHIRAPHLMYHTGAIKQWRHKPEILIKGCCNYTAHYLGSTLVKELKGAMSTQEGIAKLKKSSEVISKIPTIMLSISFKGVKFIDAASKKVVCDHEIANIFCACQDGEHMNFFAYITKDREVGKHYCHVFSVRSRELAGEIILTLGEAFEIAYQMALKERAEKDAEEFEKHSVSDGDDTTSISSKASVRTV